jgi:alpha-tubulin suppressor-like RCC1 family protein
LLLAVATPLACGHSTEGTCEESNDCSGTPPPTPDASIDAARDSSLPDGTIDAGGTDADGGGDEVTPPVEAGADADGGGDGSGDDGGGDADAGTVDPVVEAQIMGIACALTASGKLYCWGGSSTFGIGDGTVAARTQATLIAADEQGHPLPPIRHVGVGYAHACIVGDDQSVYCWGDGSLGQLGTGELVGADGGSSVVLAPRKLQVTGTQLWCGLFHCCLKGSSDTLKCWGSNTAGELGHATGTDGDVTVPGGLVVGKGNPTPKDGPTISGIVTASMGFAFGCAMNTPTPSSQIACWGYDNIDQLAYPFDGGLGNPTPQYTSFGNGVVKSVSAGVAHGCALDTSGGAYCWGSSETGQLGSSVSVARGAESTSVKVGTGVAGVFAGVNDTCIIDATRHVQCWGDDNGGQLGIDPAQAPISQCPGTTGPCDPSAHTINDGAGPLAGASSLAVGPAVCAIKTDGALWCWGAARLVGDGRPVTDGGATAVQLTAVRVAGLPPP